MRGMTRFVVIHSRGAIFVSALSEVECEFVIDVAIELVAMKQRLNAKSQFAKPM